MSASLKASTDGTQAIIQVGGADKVIIGTDGITPESLAQKLTLGTAQATTSGTSIDFTAIPSWVKRITVMLNGVSTNGTSLVILTLGTSLGLETSGYIGASAQLFNGATVSSTNLTSSIIVEGAASVSAVRSGAITLTLLGSNTWVISGAIGRSDANATQLIAGAKTLAGTLDRLRLTTANGTDTFDAGSANIMYEG